MLARACFCFPPTTQILYHAGAGIQVSWMIRDQGFGSSFLPLHHDTFPLHTNPLFTSGRSAVRFLCLGADPGAVPAHFSLSIYALMEQTKRLSDRATWRSCVVQHLPVTRSIVYRYLDRSSATVATREGRYCILFLDGVLDLLSPG